MTTSLIALLLCLPHGITDQQFARLHKMLQPPKSEVWRSIPWKVSLLEAQSLAAREKKPIFIWAMDGHPLGCT